jgi:uncharacterized protein YecT (DUF1311 family)
MATPLSSRPAARAGVARRLSGRALGRCAWVLALTVGLTACFDMAQQVTIADGQLSYRAQLKVDAQLLAVADEDEANFCQGLAERRPEGLDLQVQQSSGGGNVICTVTAQGPLSRFETQAQIGSADEPLVRITRLDGERLRIEGHFQANESSQDAPGVDDMVRAMFAGRSLSWAVQAPRIVESNGEVNAERTRVTWRVPVAQALAERRSFYAVVAVERDWWAPIVSSVDRLGAQASAWLERATAGDPQPAPAATPPSPKESAPRVADARDPEPFAPSFNCDKATSGQEVLVCADRYLSRLDVALSVAYARALERSDDPAALRRDQLEWLKYERGACAERSCLIEAYQVRLAQLRR